MTNTDNANMNCLAVEYFGKVIEAEVTQGIGEVAKHYLAMTRYEDIYKAVARCWTLVAMNDKEDTLTFGMCLEDTDLLIELPYNAVKGWVYNSDPSKLNQLFLVNPVDNRVATILLSNLLFDYTARDVTIEDYNYKRYKYDFRNLNLNDISDVSTTDYTDDGSCSNNISSIEECNRVDDVEWF